MHEHRIQHFRMLASGTSTCADHRAHGERQVDLTAEHVAHECCVVHELVETHTQKVDEHEVHHRTQTGCGSADRGPDEAHLRDRTVAYARGAELGDQPARLAERSTPGVHNALTLFAGAAGD